MGNLFEEDDDEFDMAAIEARHAELEALELLEQQEAEQEALRSTAENAPESMDVPESTDASDAWKAAEQSGEQQTLWETEEKPEEKRPDEKRREGVYPESDGEAIAEAVLFTMGNSVELRQLAVAIDQSTEVARRVVERLQKRYEEENRGMQIIVLEDSYQMTTRAKYYENLIRVATAPKKHVLTEVVLETLSIIAYKQPVTKMEISRIRGVSSDHAVNRLIEYGLVYEVGRMDAPGRPALFATTEEFLRRFGVGSTDDLPSINPEQEDEIEQEVQEELQLQLGEAVMPESAQAEAAEAAAEAAAAVTEDTEAALPPSENGGDEDGEIDQDQIL